MIKYIHLLATITGVSLASCNTDSMHSTSRSVSDLPARLELSLTGNDSGALSNGSLLIDDVTGERKVRNIVIGIFKDDRVLSVQNITNPNVGSGDVVKNVITCSLKGTPAAECTAVVLANVLSSNTIAALKSAVTKARFLSVRIPFDGDLSNRNASRSCLALHGNVRDMNRGGSPTFTLIAGETTSGLCVELHSMASHAVACKVNAD